MLNKKHDTLESLLALVHGKMQRARAIVDRRLHYLNNIMTIMLKSP